MEKGKEKKLNRRFVIEENAIIEFIKWLDDNVDHGKGKAIEDWLSRSLKLLDEKNEISKDNGGKKVPHVSRVK